MKMMKKLTDTPTAATDEDDEESDRYLHSSNR